MDKLASASRHAWTERRSAIGFAICLYLLYCFLSQKRKKTEGATFRLVHGSAPVY
jgi:hypothetical protein